MNESQTRYGKIDPALKAAGWGIVEDSRVITEYPITRGRVSKTSKPNPLKADYVLVYKGAKLAIVEAKSVQKDVSEGVAQAKQYASMMGIRFTYATNGDEIYGIDMKKGEKGPVLSFPSPEEIFQSALKKEQEPKDGWRTEKFGAVCNYYKGKGLFPTFPYVGMENIEAGCGVSLGTTSACLSQSSSFHFFPENVLYGRLQSYLNKVVIANFVGWCSTEVFHVRRKECIPSFLQYCFLADVSINRINATCSERRMTRDKMKDILSFDILFPEKNEKKGDYA